MPSEEYASMVVRTGSKSKLLERLELFKSREHQVKEKTEEEQMRAKYEKKKKLRKLSASRRVQEEAESRLALEMATSDLRVAQRKLDRLRSLNHAEVIALCEKEAKLSGWETSTSLGAFEILYQPELGRLDLFLKKHGSRICALEVKEFVASASEVRRGVGQCLFSQLYGVDVYLVIPVKQYSVVHKVDKWLGDLGLMVYDRNGNLRIVRGVNIFEKGMKGRGVFINSK